MKKKDKIYDSPEYKQIREHLPEILKEMERDKGLKQYQMPEGWNEDFERIYQAEHRKERIRNRILAGACAAIILGIGAVHVGERLELTSMVQADDIGKTTENGFEEGEYQYSTYGNVYDEEMVSEDEDEILLENADTEQLYKEMKETIKLPFVWIRDLPSDYGIDEVAYSKIHKIISYRIYRSDEYMYIRQQIQIDDTGSGVVNEKLLEDTVWVEALKQNVDIYRSTQDDSLSWTMVYRNNMISATSNMDVESLKEILSQMYYR